MSANDDTSAFPKYPEIVLLPRRPEIFAVKEVIATEKLHGSNFRMFFPCGMTSVDEIRFGSREVEHVDGQPFPLPHALAWCKARPDVLMQMLTVIKSYGFNDVAVFGEMYGPGIPAKGIKYSNGSETMFRAFDIMVGANFLTYDLFCEVVDKMGIPRVHEVWRGDPTKENFDALLEQPSAEATLNGITIEGGKAPISEGVIIRSNPLLRTVFGEWLMFKHKSLKFTEVRVADPKKEREATPLDFYIEEHVTEGRIRNAVGRLGDRGVVLKNAMSDMPVLIREVAADLAKEGGEAWEFACAGVVEKSVHSSVSKVLGPIYRAYLEGLNNES